MNLEERYIRRILLAKAIDINNAGGKVLRADELTSIEVQAKSFALSGAHGPEGLEVAYIGNRAKGMLDAVETKPRLSSICALQEYPDWYRIGIVVVPTLALLVGFCSNQITNPHKVDLLAPQFLAVVFWNLAVYAALITTSIAAFRLAADIQPGSMRKRTPFRKVRDIFHERGTLAFQIRDSFYRYWNEVAGELTSQRLKCMMHLAAAAWAAGLSLSLLLRGLIVEYRAGWESTFLDPSQVQAILNILFFPVMTTFGVTSFSKSEIAALQFNSDMQPVLSSGAKWVWLYIGLFLTFVVVPRLCLAGYANWRGRKISQALELSFDAPYFHNVISALKPKVISIGFFSPWEDGRRALLRIFGLNADTPLKIPYRLLQTHSGDELVITECDGPTLGFDAFLIICQRSNLQFAQIREPAVPASSLFITDERGAQTPHDSIKRLSVNSFSRNWTGDSILFDAIQSLFRDSQLNAFIHVRAAWDFENIQRYRQSVRLIAGFLVLAAEQVESSGGQKPKFFELDAAKNYRLRFDEAKLNISNRLETASSSLHKSLCVIYGDHLAFSSAIEQATLANAHSEGDTLLQKKVLGGAVAGAATGAALGVKLDILSLGASMGAFAAIGAVLGGGSAMAVSVWDTDSMNPSSEGLVQLSDKLMLGLTQLQILRYLTIVHFGRAHDSPEGKEVGIALKEDVTTELKVSAAKLTLVWQRSRQHPGSSENLQKLEAILELITTRLLSKGLLGNDMPDEKSAGAFDRFASMFGKNPV